MTKATDGKRTAPPAIVDLFAGIGCVADGFAENGFTITSLVDIDASARETYLHNRPDANYLIRDVADLGQDDLPALTGGASVTGVVGCPPCQGFSAAGQRNPDDDRNALLGSFFAAVDLIGPDFFLLENVPAAIYQPTFRKLVEERADDWAIVYGVLNSACYGLPQTRQRAIVLGYRRYLGVKPTLPPPTHFGTRPVFNYRTQTLETPAVDHLDALLGESPHIGVAQGERRRMRDLLPADPAALLDLVTVADAIADLEPLTGGDAGMPSPYANALRNGRQPANHLGWRHRPDLVARLAATPEGGRAATAKPYYSQAYARLHRQGLARTLTTNFHNAGCGRFTHYAEPRTLTVREAARLQGIKDDFELIGDRSLQERLVGNAFPKLWAAAIAGHIAAELIPCFVTADPCCNL